MNSNILLCIQLTIESWFVSVSYLEHISSWNKTWSHFCPRVKYTHTSYNTPVSGEHYASTGSFYSCLTGWTCLGIYFSSNLGGLCGKKKGVYIMNTGFKPNTQQWISFSVLNRIRARRHWMAICKQSTYLKKKCIRWTYFPSKYFPSRDLAFECGSGWGQGHWWFQFPEAELSPWKCYCKHSMSLTVKFFFLIRI